MFISIECDCGHQFKVSDEAAGKRLRCPKCGRAVPAPAALSAAVLPKSKKRRKHEVQTETRFRAAWWIAGSAGAAAVTVAVILVLVFGGFGGQEPATAPVQPVAAAVADAALTPSATDPGGQEKGGAGKPLPGTASDPFTPNPGPPMPVLAPMAPMAPMAGAAPMLPVPMPMPPLSAGKKLAESFKVRLSQFGQARFEHAAFRDRPWTGVIVEIEALVPEAKARFQSVTIQGRTATGAEIKPAILFVAGGRQGLAVEARVLAGSVGKSGTVIINKERYVPWPVGSFGRTAVEVASAGEDTARVHLPPNAADFRTGDFLVSMPVLLENGGGVEYGFMRGKKAFVGFLFPTAKEDLAHLTILGHAVALDPAERDRTLIAVTDRAPAPAIAPQLPLPEGAVALEEVGRVVTPITDPITKNVKERFAPLRVAFAPDGRDFAGVGSARACWGAEGGLIWGTDERAESVGYSADGARIIVVGDGHASVHERKTGKKLTNCRLGDVIAPNIFLTNPAARAAWRGVGVRDPVVISPSGKAVIAPTAIAAEPAPGKLVYSDFGMRIFETASGKEIRKFPQKHTGWVTCLALSPDGKKLLSGSEDKTVRLWDVNTGKELKVYREHTAKIVAVGWSGDGARIVTAAEDYDVDLHKQLIAQKKPTDAAHLDATARVWDLATGSELFRIKERVGLRHAFLSPDGRFLAIGRKIWEVGNEKARYVSPSGFSAHLLAFSPDGRLVLASEPNSALVRYRFPEPAR
jgi:hypothetical protein